MTYIPSTKKREDYRIVELKYLSGRTKYVVEAFDLRKSKIPEYGVDGCWHTVQNTFEPYWPPAEFATKAEAENFIKNYILVEVKVV